MKGILLALCLAGLAIAQAPKPDPRFIGPAAPAPGPGTTPDFLSRSEVAQVRDLLARLNPPPLEGMTLPEKFRSASVNVFMSSTCPHCAAEVPYLKELEASGAKINAVFFATDTKAEAFMAGLGWQHKPLLETADDAKAVPIRGTPTTLVLDAAGKVKKAFYGELTADQRKELLALAKAQ